MKKVLRKQLSVQILEYSFQKLEEIKEETGLSNAKIIEMLLASYTNTNTTAIQETTHDPIPKKITKIPPKPVEEPKPIPTFKPKPTQPKKPTYSKTYSFTIPETASVGEPEKTTKQYGIYPLTWLVSEGQCAHYDKDGDLIIYRYTDGDGVVVEPDEYDMDRIQAEHDRIKEEKERKRLLEEDDERPF